MLNYYRILEVPDFSAPVAIQKSYRKLAKKYHPDVSGELETEELFKLVNEAYRVLSNPLEKNRYDLRLRQALQYDRLHGKKSAEDAEIKAKQAAWRARGSQREIQNYEKSNRTFPYRIRIALALVGSIWGLQLIYSHWFVNLNDYSTWFLTMGFFIFIACALFFLSALYTHYRIRDLLSEQRIPYENISLYLFMGLLITGPSLIIGLNTLRKSYHLSEFGKIERAKIEDVRYSRVIFSFSPDGKEQIMKSTPLKEEFIFDMNQKWILIRFSSVDPRICKPVRRSD